MKGKESLTKAEEEVMQHLWRLGQGYLKDLWEAYPEPRPAYTTIGTVVRVLVKKKFIGYKAHGKVHEYYPLVSKQAYFGKHIGRIVKTFFNDSPASFASFFTSREELSLEELEEIRKIIDQKIDDKKDPSHE